jgi:hypothetical protein
MLERVGRGVRRLYGTSPPYEPRFATETKGGRAVEITAALAATLTSSGPVP